MAVSKRTRFEVLKRDNHTCRYCGGTAPAMRLAAERKAAADAVMIAYCRSFEDDLAEYGWPKSIYAPVMPDGWQDSIENFYRAGLPLDQLKRALAAAMTKSHIGRYDKFRYKCGICWSVLNELREDASRIVSEQ